MTWAGAQGFQTPIEPESFIVDDDILDVHGVYGNLHQERNLTCECDSVVPRLSPRWLTVLAGRRCGVLHERTYDASYVVDCCDHRVKADRRRPVRIRALGGLPDNRVSDRREGLPVRLSVVGRNTSRNATVGMQSVFVVGNGNEYLVYRGGHGARRGNRRGVLSFVHVSDFSNLRAGPSGRGTDIVHQ